MNVALIVRKFRSPESIKVLLSALIDEGWTVGDGLYEKTIDEYVDLIKRKGAKAIPPITIRDEGNGHYLIVQGHHRVVAVKRAGLSSIQANVLEMD